VLYEALSGRPPFDGPSPTAIAAKHVDETPAPLLAGGEDWPERLPLLVMRCLRKEPADRPGSMHEVSEEIALIRREVAGTTRPGAALPPGAARRPPSEAPGISTMPPGQGASAGIDAWKEYVERARAWAKRQRSADAAMKLGEIEFAIAGLESAEAEIAALLEEAAEIEAKEGAARERFERALGSPPWPSGSARWRTRSRRPPGPGRRWCASWPWRAQESCRPSGTRGAGALQDRAR
jgi:hypothetical protein